MTSGRPIVVGVDGSTNSHEALQWAVAEGAQRGVPVRALNAWFVNVVAGHPFAPMPYEPELYEKGARAILDAAVDAIDETALAQPVERVVVHNSPANALIRASEDADLVVVGARGHGGFAGLLLGSVSTQVVHHARCPVVVVPAPGG